MRLINVTRGFAFHISVVTALLILSSMIGLGALVYWSLDDVLEKRVSNRIEEQVSRLIGLSKPDRRAQIITEVERLTRPGNVRRSSYKLTSETGEHIAGDLWLGSNGPGWSRQAVPESPEADFRARLALILTVEVEDGLRLSIGRDIGWIDEVRDVLLNLLLWAMGGALALAIFVALLASALVARRIDSIVGAASAIMHGNLGHRIPVTGSHDDFDRLSETLNEMLDRIRGLVENIEQITNDIAHDLRTPLGRLRQRLEQARGYARSTEEYAVAVDRAINEADVLLSTFGAMLRIAQIQAGAQRAAFHRIDLSEVISAVAEAYALDAEDKGHRIALEVGEGQAMEGDRDLLAQAFSNLVENALVHTPPGCTIRIGLHRAPEGIVAFVADNGPGVPADERERIFQRFYRLEASRTTPRTGLGLSLVAAVAKMHNATVAATDNEPGLRISLTFSDQRSSMNTIKTVSN